MTDQPHDPKTGAPTASTAARGGGSGAAAAVTGDNADAGAWPDDIAPDRGSASGDSKGAASASSDGAIPQPEQAPMDEDAGGPTAPAPAEDEAAKLGDFA